MRISTDILIVGAGPAGATTSLSLSQKGIAHVILDAAEFPRDKVCGDGLDLKVIRVLRHLDPAYVDAQYLEKQGLMPCFGTRFITDNGRAVDFSYADKPLFWTARRFAFDQFLAQKMASPFADFRQGTRVVNIIRDGKSWIVQAQKNGQTLEFSAKLLIGADGEQSAVLRYLGERDIDRRHYAATLRQYWSGVQGIAPGNLIEVYFPKGYPMSYFYIFPLPNGEANVGYGMVSEVISKNGFNLRDIFKKLLSDDPVMAPRFAGATALETPKGWGLPLASRARKASGDGYLLVGDAASLVCPTSGEGIGSGMMSGYVAAQFIEKAVKNNSFSEAEFQHYTREITRRLQDEIRLYNLMMRVSPKIFSFGLNLLAPSPVLRWSFNSRVEGWMRTAYETPIDVRF